jgi:hypothetical protein
MSKSPHSAVTVIDDRLQGDSCAGETSAHGGQDEAVAPDEPYDWADDPELSPEDIRARMRGLPAVPVFTSQEDYLLASGSVFRLVEPSSNSSPAPVRVLPAATFPAVRWFLVSPAT